MPETTIPKEKAASENKEKTASENYEPVIPDIEEWPIYLLTKNRDTFIEELVQMSKEKVTAVANTPQKLQEELAKTMYKEQIRIKSDPWKVDDTKAELKFWKGVKKNLIRTSVQKPTEEGFTSNETILTDILTLYANEIAGNFNPKTYNLAGKVLPLGFNQLLNSSKLFRKGNKSQKDRIKIVGNIDLIRSLVTKGTILLVPTHFSNLDSILVGWGLHTIGLPAFIYGAGLNLFNSSILGYFMGNLGAYTVDRRKKNSLYLNTLKLYAQLALQRGAHSLFFPGGTRSRSGQLETRLKLGLLGAAIAAQRSHFVQDAQDKKDLSKSQKIFVVPLVLNYHFTLEASSLIDQHLKRSGKDRYFIDKQVFPSRKLVRQFLWKFLFSTKSEIILSFGQPMDIFGHPVDQNGNSLGINNTPVDISAYFKTEGAFKEDPQRDAEYTKMLSEKIVKQYYKYNRVMSSHLIAFCAFEILLRKHRRLDLYGLLRIPEEDRIIPKEQFTKVVFNIREALKKKQELGQVHLAGHMYGDIDRIITHGIMNLGVYHTKDPLFKTKEGDMSSQDMNLLYYYHNRLVGYELEELI